MVDQKFSKFLQILLQVLRQQYIKKQDNMTDRAILQSQMPINPQGLGELSEEITNMMRERRYNEVLGLCQKMSISKQKYMIICYAYLGLKQWKRLIQSCDSGLDQDLKQAQFYALKGKAMGKLGKHHEKILLLEKAISLNPKMASYYRNLGSAYYNMQKYELACQKYDKAIELEPENLLNYHNKGSALLKNQDYESAKKCYQMALAQNPNVALSYSGVADCQKTLGNFDEAEKMYKKAYEISGKEVYRQQMSAVQRQKQLKSYKDSWLYSLVWLRQQVF